MTRSSLRLLAGPILSATALGVIGCGGDAAKSPSSPVTTVTAPAVVDEPVAEPAAAAAAVAEPVAEPAAAAAAVAETSAAATTTLALCAKGSYTIEEGDAPATVAATLGVALADLDAVNVSTEGYASFVAGTTIIIPGQPGDIACGGG